MTPDTEKHPEAQQDQTAQPDPANAKQEFDPIDDVAEKRIQEEIQDNADAAR